MKRILIVFVVLAALVLSALSLMAAAPSQMIGVNIVLNTDISKSILADLGTHGTVRDVIYEINALTMQVASGELRSIQALPYVASANPDAARNGSPIDRVSATDFTNGINTWNLDAINVTELQSGTARIAPAGSGVYVAMLDTGLLDSWRQYFPQERIAEEYAIAFGGGAGLAGWVSSQPNKWEHDQDSHGTHTTSTILGYSMAGTPINGVAAMATVIPVKVLNQNGSGWSSVIARGIVYVADLKSGPLANYPVVINMSLGGPSLDAVEKAAIDYAISQGVIIVASAGNRGVAGMGYPGAYAPVISVGASGWVGEWGSGSWWYANDVPDPTDAEDFYVTDFSGRARDGQDLDVLAPGSWVVGPYQENSGQTSYYFLGGTSMSTPHVTGIVALMLERNPSLTAQQVEGILEDTAILLPAGCRDVLPVPGASTVEICWGDNATGAGVATADAALAATAASVKSRKNR